MYSIYLAGVKMPVFPSAIEHEIPSKNETITLLNGQEINILKKAGLREYPLELYLPQVKYPFAYYPEDTFQQPIYYLNLFKKLKDDLLPFQMDIYRELPGGKQTWYTNQTVSLEDYTVEENADYGQDVKVTLQLKEYTQYGTQRVTLNEDGLTYTTTRADNRAVNRYHICTEGDSLLKIAFEEFGTTHSDMILYLYELNRETFEAWNWDKDCIFIQTHPGMILRLVKDGE